MSKEAVNRSVSTSQTSEISSPRTTTFGSMGNEAAPHTKRRSIKGTLVSTNSNPSGSSADVSTSASGAVGGGPSPIKGTADPEKEILRRQSIALSAEVEKYRHLVVQSLDEIRTLKDNRRRSLAMLNNGTGATGAPGGGALVSAREQYLMNELFKVQNELDSIKKERKKMERRQKGRDKDKAQLKGGSKSPVQNARGGESGQRQFRQQ
ncbi:hypothetical protein PINS_up019289 [Pythium insidiosum]|nr:hypothetical protein PINS_up019289 [Pythium insidiosum]